MTELLYGQQRIEYVLEIGTGSGYQTALLASLFKKVHTIERIERLQKQAQQRHQALGLTNIRYKLADGQFGWPELGPYDAIICTCAPEVIPDTLCKQLSDNGGRLILPIGAKQRDLWLIERQEEQFEQTLVEEAFFVPLKKGVLTQEEFEKAKKKILEN